MLLLLKIGVISGFVTLVAWIVVYSRLAAWWRNAIGRTLVAKTALIAALMVPFALSLFFHLNRLNSRVVGWVDTSLILAITPVMIWRIAVWLKISHKDREAGHRESGPPPASDDTLGGLWSVSLRFSACSPP
jgi:hypothetical protein